LAPYIEPPETFAPEILAPIILPSLDNLIVPDLLVNAVEVIFQPPIFPSLDYNSPSKYPFLKYPFVARILPFQSTLKYLPTTKGLSLFGLLSIIIFPPCP
jgi:hypothetical protein